MNSSLSPQRRQRSSFFKKLAKPATSFFIGLFLFCLVFCSVAFLSGIKNAHASQISSGKPILLAQDPTPLPPGEADNGIPDGSGGDPTPHSPAEAEMQSLKAELLGINSDGTYGKRELTDTDATAWIAGLAGASGIAGWVGDIFGNPDADNIDYSSGQNTYTVGANSLYQRVYDKTGSESQAKAAANTAAQEFGPVLQRFIAADQAYDSTGKSSKQIDADPVLKAQALEFEASKKAMLEKENQINQRYGVASEATVKRNQDIIDQPAGTIIAKQDAVLNRIQEDKAAAIRGSADPIFCIKESDQTVAKDGAKALIPNVDVQGCIGLGLYYGFLKPSAFVLWAAGVAFNYSIDFTLNFGKFIREQGLGTAGTGAIYVGWAAIRDLLNVGFIFILLYAGISTILGNDDYGIKQTVLKVVMAALLINFSLFFTKALIDLSNIVALQFYTRVLSASDRANASDNALAGRNSTNAWDAGLSIGFVNALGLKTIWITKDSNSTARDQFGPTLTASQLIIVALGGGCFILVTAFVFFMATLRFMYRSAVLIFLMVLSPIGFIGKAIPPLSGAADKWMKRLKSNLIFAPAYMAIFYVVALIVFGSGIGPSQVGANSNINGGSVSGFAALFQGNVSQTGLLFWFIMIIVLMLGTQLAADAFADDFKMADAFKKKAKGWATSAGKSAAGGFGLAGYTGRRALGVASNMTTGRVGQALLLNGVVRNLGGDKLYNKLGKLKEVPVAGKSLADVEKDKKALSTDVYKQQVGRTTRRYGEDEKDFEKRKAARRREVDESYYGAKYNPKTVEENVIDPATGLPVIDPATGLPKKRKKVVTDAQGNIKYDVDWGGSEKSNLHTFGKSRRKMYMDRMGAAKKGPPKDRNVGDLEKRMAELDADLEKTVTHPIDSALGFVSKIEARMLKYNKALEDFETANAARIAQGNSAVLDAVVKLTTLASAAKTQFSSMRREQADLSKKIADMNAK
jgi:hypothetical protein